MEQWTERGSPGGQRAMGAGMLALGLVFVWLCRHLDGASTDVKCGFALGVLLAVIGLGALLTAGEHTTTIDSATRTITVVDENPFRRSTRHIAFEDVVDVTIQGLGGQTSGARTYSLGLRLRDGSRATLFPPGRFYEGCRDRNVVAAKRDRLLRQITTTPTAARDPLSR